MQIAWNTSSTNTIPINSSSYPHVAQINTNLPFTKKKNNTEVYINTFNDLILNITSQYNTTQAQNQTESAQVQDNSQKNSRNIPNTKIKERARTRRVYNDDRGKRKSKDIWNLCNSK